MWGRSALFALVLAALTAHAARAANACVLDKFADLPVTMVGSRPTITAKINGQDVRLLVDSGAFFSMMQPEAAKRLGLRIYPLPGRLSVAGVSGRIDAQATTVKEFKLGPFTLPQVDFVTGQAGVFDTGVIGLLGQNFLSAFDVEYDLANGVIRLFQPKGKCDGPRAYWGGAYSVVPIGEMTTLDPHLIGRVAVNGKTLHATFDTGAGTSVLSLHAASQLGLTPQSPGVRAIGMMRGLGTDNRAAWVTPIDSFALDGETITKTRLLMADIELQNSDILIGADFFLAHRVYVATGQRRIYITYNGGPVFSLGGNTAQPAAHPAEGGEGAPTDADGFARRAAASMARRDFAAALADFNRAIDLDPMSAKLFHDRSVARLALRQPTLAMADLDQAVKLKPDDVQSLLERGGLYLGLSDTSRAASDFETAIALPNADPEVRLAVAAAYMRVQLYDKAVAQYDLWIADHPKHRLTAEALSGRCLARAEGNRALDLALADCEAALKLRPRTPTILNNRALVRLRMNQIDSAIADFDEALKVQPKQPWALYVRGLAEQRKGLKAQGDADMAAGLALNASLPVRARQLGLAPAPSPEAKP